MPRVNPLRSLANERNVAARIKYEREQRSMTYDALATHMAQAGTPIQSTAIFKIEKGDPPRRITVDELVGFAKVFGLDVEAMLLPMGLVLDARSSEITHMMSEALSSLAESVRVLLEGAIELVKLEQSSVDTDAAVLRQALESPFALRVTYPMGDENDPDTPDPVGAAWGALSGAIFEYARWHITENQQSAQAQTTSRRGRRGKR